MFRRLIYSILIVAFVWVIFSRSAEISLLAETLTEGNWDWVFAATGVEILYLFFFAFAYQAAFFTVEIKARFGEIFPVMLGSMFVNAVAPGGGVAGVALFVDDQSRRGHSGARATAGMVVHMIADFSSLTLILILSMTYLFIWDSLPSYVVIGSLVLFLITGVLSAILITGWKAPIFLERTFRGIQKTLSRLVNPFMREPLLPEDWAVKSSSEFIGASQAFGKNPRRLLRTVFLMMVTHLMAIGGLFMLFLAFDYRIGVGQLVTTYAVGILTWIVSPAPQGTGVIEGAMVLTATTLGVPWNVAMTATLAFRGLTFWLPVIWGFFMLRKVKTFEPTPGPEWEEGGVQVVALLIGWLGLINILMSIAPSAHDQLVILGRISPFFVPYEFPITEFLTGLALMIAANGLWRRKRVIWMLMIASLLLLSGFFILVSERYDLVFLSLGLAIWLIILNPKFTIASDMPSIRMGLVVAGVGLALALVLGVGGVYFLGNQYGYEYNLAAAANQTLVMFSQFYNPGFEPILSSGIYLIIGIYILGASSLGYLLMMAMRPVQIWRPATIEERSQARRLVEKFGRSSLAYLTLFEDKAYYFSPGGSVIAYTVQSRVALTLGDPIGPEEDFKPAIKDFRVFCAKNDWVPGFCMALPNNLKDYRDLKFDAMCLGHEAVISMEEFKLEGNANKSFRKRFNRLQREGFRVVIHEPPISSTLLIKLRQVSDEWLSMTKGSEKRFFLGRFDEEYLRSGAIAVVYTPDGEATAFTNIVPEFQLNEITIDLMRRKPNTESGTMDYLFVTLFMWAQEKGFGAFNLGLCALSALCEDVSLPIVQRGLSWFYDHGSWIYHFKGVFEFKDKFHPSWTPQYLMYPSIVSLPEIWFAMILANAGEDDFPWKFIMRKSNPTQPSVILSQPLDAQI